MTYGYGRSLAPRQRRGQPSRNPAVSRTRVSLAGREVALWQLRRAAGDYRALVEKAKVTDGCAWCLCTDPAPRLVIRHREGIYYLACWPGGGQAHARGCEFRNTGGQWSGRGYYQAGALQETDDGAASVALSLPLHVRTTNPAAAGVTPSPAMRGLRGHGWACWGCCTVVGTREPDPLHPGRGGGDGPARVGQC